MNCAVSEIKNEVIDMLHCGECEKCFKLGDGSGHGVCSVPESYFPVEKNDECVYLQHPAKTCVMCSHFGTDFACMTATATDSACGGFEDKLEMDVMNILFQWFLRDEYSRAKLEQLCVEFEQTPEYRFVWDYKQKHPSE